MSLNFYLLGVKTVLLNNKEGEGVGEAKLA